jgi:uncharacterized protein involved in high-affinity Fe2+ transport
MIGKKLRLHRIFTTGGTVALMMLAVTVTARAGEQPAGEPMAANGMDIQGIFLQAVKMEPAMSGQDAAKSDIHLEADIHAARGNENGFAAGEWIPYLAVDYTLAKTGSDWTAGGTLRPMVASDGPHYGANVTLDGPGEYTVRFDIKPPSANGFMRHTDRETGVAPWWKPFAYEGSFVFAGTGKKGGY